MKKVIQNKENQIEGLKKESIKKKESFPFIYSVDESSICIKNVYFQILDLRHLNLYWDRSKNIKFAFLINKNEKDFSMHILSQWAKYMH